MELSGHLYNVCSAVQYSTSSGRMQSPKANGWRAPVMVQQTGVPTNSDKVTVYKKHDTTVPASTSKTLPKQAMLQFSPTLKKTQSSRCTSDEDHWFLVPKWCPAGSTSASPTRYGSAFLLVCLSERRGSAQLPLPAFGQQASHSSPQSLTKSCHSSVCRCHLKKRVKIIVLAAPVKVRIGAARVRSCDFPKIESVGINKARPADLGSNWAAQWRAKNQSDLLNEISVRISLQMSRF